ncbi:ran binding ran-specific gtpase-activatingprotein [Lichtheimia corymbifera JMRC:FSU:9682]|uniref:Ran binding ran-specific gtpase-activatingprotein n=1 Tax=Lichtheimia corymbifera JMRC:FSU:9682 TaxID=1263082 RepID=A0A068RKF5_9FUNG|nr:ran binding ran-specific gtpase-activatingprotein [Lichtheimia corymbifera JMRC:FSU:9682]
MSSLEDLFGKLAMTTVNTVSRIAISHATNAAIRGVTTYIKQKPKDNTTSRELTSLQRQFDLKIKNLKPTIDVIAHSVADGNQDLQPALEMCNDLQREIDDFANEMQDSKANNTDEYVRQRLRHLLNHIDDTVPSLYLALRNIPSKASLPLSRLLQASAVLQQPSPSQPFYLRLYSLFAASASGVLSWKEEYPKCQLVIQKAGDDDEGHPFARKLVITEDLDDGRFHEEGEKPHTLILDMEHLKRMYYTRSGTLLNLEDSREAVLVLKVLKKTPSAEDKDSASSSPQIKAKEKDPKIERDELQEADWYALEIWKNGDANDDDDEDEYGDEGDENKKKDSKDTVKKKNTTNGMEEKSLLLLESVIKLSLLEITERMDHLRASDDLIRLYMEE